MRDFHNRIVDALIGTIAGIGASLLALLLMGGRL